MSDTSKFWCPRRAENGEPPRFFPEQDCWRPGRFEWRTSSSVGVVPGTALLWRTCSYCGSAHPADMFSYIEHGGEIGPTDKSYKIYCPSSPQKFYFQHMNETEKRQFVDMMNEGRIKFTYPGYFYVKPYFCAQ